MAHPSVRFQVGDCGALPFKPKVNLRLRGATKRAGYPALQAALVFPTDAGTANVARAQVNLPRSEFLEQGHIRTVCTRVQWGAGAGGGAACPQASIYGWAKAWTPLLDQPLEGPVHLRSSSHKLPDLVAGLRARDRGRGLGPHRHRPEQGHPGDLRSGPRRPGNLCAARAKRKAIARIVGQNGKVEHYEPVVQNQCKRHMRHKAGHRHKGSRSGTAKRVAAERPREPPPATTER